MIRVHILEGGDIIKILPMIDRNGKIIWYKEHFCVFIHNLNRDYHQLIYDCSDKNKSSLEILPDDGNCDIFTDI